MSGKQAGAEDRESPMAIPWRMRRPAEVHETILIAGAFSSCRHRHFDVLVQHPKSAEKDQIKGSKLG